jgi:hypothetical protein
MNRVAHLNLKNQNQTDGILLLTSVKTLLPSPTIQKPYEQQM